MKTIIYEFKCLKCDAEIEPTRIEAFPQDYAPDKISNWGICDDCEASISEDELEDLNNRLSELTRIRMEEIMHGGEFEAMVREVAAAKE